MSLRNVLGRLAGVLCAALALLAAWNVVADRDYAGIVVVAVLGDLSWHFLLTGSAGCSVTVRTARAIGRAVVADARARLRRERAPEGSLIPRLSRMLTVPGGILGMGVAFADVMSSRASRIAFPGMQPTARHLSGNESGQLVAGLILGLLIGRYAGAVLGRALDERRASRRAGV